jgi:hypothetical protein
MDDQLHKEHQRLINVVQQMRKAQRRYFKHRKFEDMAEAKRFEKVVDSMVFPNLFNQNK